MNKFFTFCLIGAFSLSANAQTAPTTPPTTQDYGKISKEDLELKSCNFEKDANAEVLFDKGEVFFDNGYNLTFVHHVRIKIFNEKAKDEGNIRIRFYGGDRSEDISGVQAETINLNNGNIEFTKVDKKLIYIKPVDKLRSELVFAFPNVQPGSVIEFKYNMACQSIGDFPDWYFQKDIPTRYSEISADIPSVLHYKSLVMVNQPFVKNTESVKALANIPSLHEEPYMNSKKDNAERIMYELASINAGSASQNFSDSWQKVGENEIDYNDFGGQFKRKLTGEEIILTKAKGIHSDNEKIAYIFNEVKNTMKWNDDDERYTNDGTSEAWNKKTGNSTEINLILYHLLKKSGINAYPMLVSTGDNGKVNPAYPSKYQFNKTVAYIPVDSANYYILDATSKYNIYKEIPADLLNTFGFYIDKDNSKYDLVFLQRIQPVKHVNLINAEIKADGKMDGTAVLNSVSYSRINAIERYKTDGEKKYIDYLRDDDNNLKISSVKFDNMEVDTLPLTQNISFTLELAGSDGNYIYFNPNLFTSLHSNPFLNQNRYSDINFGYLSSYQVSGNYKIPAGYKIDALPKNIILTMPDKSISFKRMVGEQDGNIVVLYTISHNKTIYFKEDYSNFYEFYKKMHELLNEQIVLKKS